VPVIFTAAVYTVVATMAGTIFTAKALAAAISDLTTDREGITVEGATAGDITVVAVMAAMAEVVMVVAVMAAVAGITTKSDFFRRVLICLWFKMSRQGDVFTFALRPYLTFLSERPASHQRLWVAKKNSTPVALKGA